ncbi:uncharacterized protein LOC124265724 isoform X2 [Haliotis rubra]|uniref:uncharacterized protein LOC124265724 isoform X2 n=1 Tax=Haliotis rubra TaxID=36100 RepID=UPI001EE597E7|nr:uncharacterized protein LOC124265724 isoform X2 [Haliotis rubra]
MSPIFATFFSQFVQVRHIFIWRKRILGTTYLSKACYGSDPSCTQHHVSCNSTQKIAIVDYYTNNPKCTQVGLSSCDNYSADGVTEHEYDRFNYTEMFSLYKKCSTKSQCVFPGPRRNVTRTFSVVKYQCIEDATKTSKACFGSPGLSCTQHNIRCRRNRTIAIYDAYYTDNIECGQAGITECGTVNPDNVTERGYYRFSNIELVSIFNQCSTATLCGYPAPRRSAALNFSVVKYQCIDNGDSLNISGGSAEGVSQVSLFHKVLPVSEQQTNMYVCNFKSELNTESISVYVLDARLRLGTAGQCFSQLSVLHGNYIATSSCSTVFQPFERLNVTQAISLYISSKGIPRLLSGFIWLRVNASEPFNVTCETVERTTPASGPLNVTCEAVERTTTGTSTVTTVSQASSTEHSILSGQTENNTGAIAGGVVATVLAVLVVTLISVWIIRHRRKKSKGKEKTESLSKDAKPDMTYSLAGKIPQNNYHEIQELRTLNSDYDYATADGMVLPPTTNTYFTIEPTGEQTARDNSTASAAEGEYDHIGNKPSQQTSDYDTTASVAQPGNTGEDDYGYNLFQKKVNPQTHQNDYDTAASATQAVAQLSTTERNTDEDDYDHCQRGTNASETVSSPYDTASGIDDNPDYSVAGQMK